MKRYLLPICLLVSLLVFLNLGRFLDVTRPPVAADIIVDLGGEWYGHRIKKTLELYKAGYAKSDYIVLTGSRQLQLQEEGHCFSDKIHYLRYHHIDSGHIIYAPGTYNTAEEIAYLKSLMIRHGWHTALIVTDPPHSRRILFLAQWIYDCPNASLHCIVVGDDVRWWHPDTYFLHRQSLLYALSELTKLSFYLVKYGIFYKLGILDEARVYLSPLSGYLREKTIHLFQRLGL